MVPDVTYNVFGGTLNLAQSTNLFYDTSYVVVSWWYDGYNVGLRLRCLAHTHTHTSAFVTKN